MVQVFIMESERGWGQRVDGTKWFKSKKAAEKFVKKYNKPNNKAVTPDWYMYATIAEK